MEHVPPSDSDMAFSSQALSEVRSYYKKFLHLQEETDRANHLLSRERDITPAQCFRTTGSLLPLDRHIQEFRTLLKQPLLPFDINKQRHEIFIALDNIHTSLDNLKECRVTLSNSHSQMEEAMAKREEISSIIQILKQNLLHLNDLLGRVLETPPTLQKTDSKDIFDIPKATEEDQKSSLRDPTGSLPIKTTQPPLFTRLRSRVVVFISNLLQILLRLRLIQLIELEGSNIVEIPGTFNQSPDFDFLYQILKNHTEDLDLQEICRTVKVSYNRLKGNSHEERANSLTTQLYNQDRLSDLEKELRRRLPRRFPNA